MNERLFLNAKLSKFDPDGYLVGRPLTKSVFHSDPYITCKHCNQLTFIDVVNLKHNALPSHVSDRLHLHPEVITSCLYCHRSDGLIIGSHDFSDEIELRQRLLRERLLLQQSSATKIQRKFRNHLRKLYGSALSNAFLASRYYKNKAAYKINSVARGRLGRRIAKTRKAIAAIRNSHPLLLTYALKSTKNQRKKVFWYTRPPELALLFTDYIELIKKTGFQPIRKIVEENLQELASRILLRKNQLIVLLQKRWRGVMSRRIVKYFKTEKIRLFQFSVSRVMMIQRIYRGHWIRVKLIPKILMEKQKEILIKNYLQEKFEIKLNQKKIKCNEKTMISYHKEREEEKTARLTSMIPPPREYDMNKMKAFWDSVFVNDRFTQDISALVQAEQHIHKNKLDSMYKVLNRRDFIHQRIADHGPEGYGLRSISPERHDDESILERHEEERQGPSRRHDSNVSDLETVDHRVRYREGIEIHGEGSQDLNSQISKRYAISLDSLDESQSQFRGVVSSSSVTSHQHPHRSLCSRSKSMRMYYQQELYDIALKLIEYTVNREGYFPSNDQIVRLRRFHDFQRYNVDKMESLRHQKLKKKNDELRLIMSSASKEDNSLTNESLPEISLVKVEQVNRKLNKKGKGKNKLINSDGSASSTSSRKMIKGYKYPKELSFNSVEWLFSETY